jgi:hypothetical protein
MQSQKYILRDPKKFFLMAKMPIISNKIQIILGRMKNKKIKIKNNDTEEEYYLSTIENNILENIVEDIFFYYVSLGLVPYHFYEDEKGIIAPYIPNIDMGKFEFKKQKDVFKYEGVWAPQDNFKYEYDKYDKKNKVKLYIFGPPVLKENIENEQNKNLDSYFGNFNVTPTSIISGIKKKLKEYDYFTKQIMTNIGLKNKALYLKQELLPTPILQPDVYNNFRNFNNTRLGKHKFISYNKFNNYSIDQSRAIDGFTRTPTLEKTRLLEEYLVRTGVKSIDGLYRDVDGTLGGLVNPVWIPNKDINPSLIKILMDNLDETINLSFGIMKENVRIREGLHLKGNVLNNSLRMFYDNISDCITQIYKDWQSIINEDLIQDLENISLVIDYDIFTDSSVVENLIQKFSGDINNLEMIFKKFLDIDIEFLKDNKKNIEEKGNFKELKKDDDKNKEQDDEGKNDEKDVNDKDDKKKNKKNLKRKRKNDEENKDDLQPPKKKTKKKKNTEVINKKINIIK